MKITKIETKNKLFLNIDTNNLYLTINNKYNYRLLFIEI